MKWEFLSVGGMAEMLVAMLAMRMAAVMAAGKAGN